MYRRRATICLFLSLLMAFILTGPTHAAAASLTAPVGATVSVEGTQFIIKWQNPAAIAELAKSAYQNYNGYVEYIVDWRVNKGAWHYEREIPGAEEIRTCYPTIPWQFFGQLVDSAGYISIPQTTINKVMVGVSYNTPVAEWLKKNNIEFRIRYIYSYYSESLQRMENQHSAFSNIVLVGTSSPAGSLEPGPVINEYGVPAPPSVIEGPKELASEYLTLNLRWKVPEDIKTVTDMKMIPVLTAIDWKMNNGEWYEGIKYLKDPIRTEYILEMQDVIPDKDGYASITLHRGALKIPPGMSLSSWLADNTYYFRVRYVIMSLEEKGLGYVFSPYSNTVTLGRGTVPPQQPNLKR